MSTVEVTSTATTPTCESARRQIDQVKQQQRLVISDTTELKRRIMNLCQRLGIENSSGRSPEDIIAEAESKASNLPSGE
ncbi:hypothetical protein KJ652_00590 [Patescibacteria group bacterium]|nr:hypothetical protein [Patescibacteria group bacterium]MBU1123069.1 hypothetical protein [Patescibacteria group bacterium]